MYGEILENNPQENLLLPPAKKTDKKWPEKQEEHYQNMVSFKPRRRKKPFHKVIDDTKCSEMSNGFRICKSIPFWYLTDTDTRSSGRVIWGIRPEGGI